MNKAGSYQFDIESYQCDFTGKATLPVIGNYILHAATSHANERGFGFDSISKDGVAWVLSRLSIEMTAYPVYDHPLTVETWVEGVSRFFTERCFRFLDPAGKVLGYCRTVWAAIDMNTRRPTDIPSWRPDLIDWVESEKECPIEKMPKIPSVDGLEATMGYSVRYSDMDINRHMNSVKYIEHAINVFDLDFFRSKIVGRFDMVYLQEGHFGEKLKIYKQDVSTDAYYIDTKRGDESICRSRIIWK